MEEIYSGISNDFTSIDAASLLCQRFINGIPFNNQSFPFKLKETVTAFEEYLNSSPSSEFLSCYVEFLLYTRDNCQELNLVILNFD